jgi:DNA processing protein
MDKDNLKYWIGFNLIPGIGRVKFSQLLSFFGNMDNAWRGTSSDFKKAGLDKTSIKNIETRRSTVDLNLEMDKLEKSGIKAYTYQDEGYPERLKEIYDYPPVIYIKGNITVEDECCLAVVGTRRSTVYGRQVTEDITSELAANKVTVVSGLARGIDTIAHRRTLEAGGRTIAVFACGLDIVYPPENRALAQRIAGNGALISEYHPGTKPKPDYFPRRNRIMSGISLGVLVVEADESSGAIITAHMALEQNREVFAVPGSILSPSSRGTNILIQEGAKLVRGGADILEELNLTVNVHQIEMKEPIPTSETEAEILKYLSREPVHIDELCRCSGLSISIVSSNLAIMELKGLVRQISAMNYIAAHEVRQEYKV